jgi:GAF domain-containing protein
MADLVRAGLDVHEREREHFLTVAGRLARAIDQAELEALREELARLTFGN